MDESAGRTKLGAANVGAVQAVQEHSNQKSEIAAKQLRSKIDQAFSAATFDVDKAVEIFAEILALVPEYRKLGKIGQDINSQLLNLQQTIGVMVEMSKKSALIDKFAPLNLDTVGISNSEHSKSAKSTTASSNSSLASRNSLAKTHLHKSSHATSKPASHSKNPTATAFHKELPTKVDNQPPLTTAWSRFSSAMKRTNNSASNNTKTHSQTNGSPPHNAEQLNSFKLTRDHAAIRPVPYYGGSTGLATTINAEEKIMKADDAPKSIIMRTKGMKFNGHEIMLMSEALVSPHTTRNSIPGQRETHEKLEEIAKKLLLRQEYDIFSREIAGRCLQISGPAGSGKFAMIEAVANSLHTAILHISKDILLGVKEEERPKLIKAIFTLATKLQPTIIYFQRCEDLAGTNEEEASLQKPSLLKLISDELKASITEDCMDRLLCVFATTKAGYKLDILGRKYTTLMMDYPDFNARKSLLTKYAKDAGHTITDKALTKLSELSEGCGIPELELLFRRRLLSPSLSSIPLVK